MPHACLPPFFSPRRRPPSPLACWHQAFAALPAQHARRLTMHYERSPEPDLYEDVLIPATEDPYLRQLTVFYLAALANNMLCTRGARRLCLIAHEGTLPPSLVEKLRHILCSEDSRLTSCPMRFPLQLASRIHGTPFSIETGGPCDMAPPAVAHRPGPGRPRGGPASILAINIGLHLTSVAMVRFDEQGGYSLSRLHRQESWPAPAAGFDRIWEQALTAARQAISGQTSPPDGIALSLAGPVRAGSVIALSGFGLYAGSGPRELADLDAAMRHSLDTAFPGLPVTYINDAEAQALFAFATCDREPETEGEYFLSLRLGACPCVRPLNFRGQAEPGTHEYGWLATRRNLYPFLPGLFGTIIPYLTYHGPGFIAQELALVAKYGLDDTEVIPFFHDRLLHGSPEQRRDAAAIYRVLGSHLAMLAAEIHRQTPLATITLLGSHTTRIDTPSFAAIAQGYDAFCARHHLAIARTSLRCLENASAQAGLVGAALDWLRR